MKLGSFCTGYGGLDLAVEAFYGAELAWYSEIDKDCNKLLELHFPRVPNIGDLTVQNWEEVEAVDIICAGFPCQPFSNAGERKGEEDERAIFQWIADCVSVLRPRIVVLENVAGILTLGGTSVIGSLAQIGYDAKWSLVRASDIGAPHTRKRWFCIATDTSSVGLQEFRSELRLGEKKRKTCSIDGNGSDDDGFTTDTAGVGCKQGTGQFPTTGGRQKEKRSEWNAESSRSIEDATYSYIPRLQRHRRLEENRSERRQPPSESNRASCNWGRYEQAIRRWEYITGRPAPLPTDERGLNTSFTEWVMGLEENWVCNQGLSRTAELKMLGNGVVPAQAFRALEILSIPGIGKND